MMESRICPSCGQLIAPGEPAVSWFTKDAAGFTIERGAVHLTCLTNHANGGGES